MSLNKGITYVNAVLLLIFIVSIAGCKRKGQASGRVINLFDGTGIADVKVEVSEEERKVLGNTGRSVGSAMTNSNGEFVIGFSGNTRSRFGYGCGVEIRTSAEDTVTVFKKVFVAYPAGIAGVPISEKGADNIELSIAPASRVAFIMNNKSGESIENLDVGIIIKGSELLIHSSEGGIAPYFFADLPSNGQIHIITRMIRNGINSQKLDTIFVQPFGKITHYIDL